MTTKKTTKNEDEEPEEEEEEYLSYTWNVAGDLHIEFHNCHDVKIMSGQPSTSPPYPPK